MTTYYELIALQNKNATASIVNAGKFRQLQHSTAIVHHRAYTCPAAIIEAFHERLQ